MAWLRRLFTSGFVLQIRISDRVATVCVCSGRGPSLPPSSSLHDVSCKEKNARMKREKHSSLFNLSVHDLMTSISNILKYIFNP
jgi:hypothetical protein